MSKDKKKVVFPKLPETYEEFIALPQAKLETPYDTAAMTVLAFSYYPKDKDLSLRMLNYLRGPRALTPVNEMFFADRFRDKDYIPRSYFKGATVENDYTPSEPYTVIPFTNPHSDLQENMKRIWLTSAGADSPRYIDARLAKDKKWYLWEQYMLVDIRPIASENPWA
ncbi:MAG: hypothetical protein IK064_05935 [Clostridia bacterium]|nr:hypothetical protein [Clostridia bacterium]MBR6007151.1 hypothetical protein [Clostridia bacterium]